jgi:integrase
MGVRVVNLKGDGNAWVQVYDKRLPTGRARIYVGKDWKKAESLARAVQHRLDRDDFSFADKPETPTPAPSVSPAPLTLKSAVGEYLDERVTFKTMEPHTRENYERTLRLHVYPTLGDRPPVSLDRDDLKSIFEGLLKAGKSKAVCRNILAPIRGSYEWLILDKKMPLVNPAVSFGKLIGERIDKKKRVKPLSPPQQAAFLEAARQHRQYFFFLVAVGAGLRLSECFGLHWTDFDLDRRVLTVERQFLNGRLIDRTKKNKVRHIPLSKELCDECLAHRGREGAIAKKRKRLLSQFVFVSRLGEPFRSKSSFLRKILHPLLVASGIQRRVTMQNLRQTFVSDLVNSGHLVAASEYAGHSSVKITGDYYSRANLDTAVVDALDVQRRQARKALRKGRPQHKRLGVVR